jgi:hypothetical protein
MASLGFPVIASVSSHSTAEHRYAWEIQVRDPGAGKIHAKNKPPRQITRGAIWPQEIYLGYDRGLFARSFLCNLRESFM